jgi:hypothetical protein
MHHDDLIYNEAKDKIEKRNQGFSDECLYSRYPVPSPKFLALQGKKCSSELCLLNKIAIIICVWLI